MTETELWNSQEHLSECPMQFTEQTEIESHEQLVRTYEELTSMGAEGVMLRAPNSPYEGKRSKYLLKYKIKEDSEAIIRGYMPGTGKYTGLLGSLKCELIIDGKLSGISFNIGTGFTDSDRENYKELFPIGSVASFSYMELSADSVPRHPVFRGIRDDFAIESTEPISDFRPIIIENFQVLIKNEETKKEPNWQFKRKAYKQIVDILSTSTEEIKNVKDALHILRNGGAKFEGEEVYFIKNLQYKNKSIQKIFEIIKTGKSEKAAIAAEDPKVKAITELTKIPEIGPASAANLYSLGITTIAELTDAYKKDKSILNNKQALGITYYSDLEKRIPREEMNLWNEFFKEILSLTLSKMTLNSETKVKIELVGSYRRNAETSGDIDLLLSSNDSQLGKIIIDKFTKELFKTSYMGSDLVFSLGSTKFMGIGKIKDFYRHIDIFYYSEKEYPFALLFATGSGQFNIEMRSYAVKHGYSLSDKELKNLKDESSVTSADYLSDIGKDFPTEEQDIFNFLGLKYIEQKIDN